MHTSHETNLSSLAQKWPSAIVSRSQVGVFTGGLINPRTLANQDALGKGPERIRVGRKIAYRADVLCRWLEEKSQVVSGGDERNGK